MYANSTKLRPANSSLNYLTYWANLEKLIHFTHWQNDYSKGCNNFFLTENKFVQEDTHFTDSVWVITEGKGPET